MRDQHPFARMLQNIGRVAFQSRNCCVTGGTSLPRFVFCLSLLASSVLLIGLTAQAQDMSKQQDQLLSQESGFLGDYYSKFQPDPNNPDLLIYWRNKDVLKNSNKFILNPVIVYLLPEAQQRGIDPEQLAKLTQYFTKAISSELKSGHYELVTKPGPGAMVLRVAITNVEPTGGMENAALKGAELAATHAAASGVALLVPRLNVGNVSIEGGNSRFGVRGSKW
jgi:hypothetical protein